MTTIVRPTATEAPQNEYDYTTSYHKWDGMCRQVPILESILNGIADAVVASWQTVGSHEKAAAKMLDGMRGSGKQHFEQLMKSQLIVSMKGGDSYAKKVRTGDLIDLVPLDSDAVKQNIDQGVIISYEVDQGEGASKKYKPEEIFHLPFNQEGARPHGRSLIEPLNDLIIDWLQVMDDQAKLYEFYSNAVPLFYLNTSDSAEMTTIMDAYSKAIRVKGAAIGIPAETVTKVEKVGFPQGSLQDPAKFEKLIVDHLLRACRYPDQALGVGTANSEETARTQFMGLRQLIRWLQKWLGANIRTQVFEDVWEGKSPKIKFSYASEAQEERFNRMMSAFQQVNAAQLDENLKKLLLIKLLKDAGVIEDDI